MRARARSISPHSVKHIPQRTCLACRQIKAKQELVRLVRILGESESIEVDINGQKAGRGAYLCQVQQCWEMALKGGRLEHSLRTTLTRENREQLIRFGEDLFKG